MTTTLLTRTWTVIRSRPRRCNSGQSRVQPGYRRNALEIHDFEVVTWQNCFHLIKSTLRSNSETDRIVCPTEKYSERSDFKVTSCLNSILKFIECLRLDKTDYYKKMWSNIWISWCDNIIHLRHSKIKTLKQQQFWTQSEERSKRLDWNELCHRMDDRAWCKRSVTVTSRTE